MRKKAEHARTLAGLVAQYEITPSAVRHAHEVACNMEPGMMPACHDALVMALLIESLPAPQSKASTTQATKGIRA